MPDRKGDDDIKLEHIYEVLKETNYLDRKVAEITSQFFGDELIVKLRDEPEITFMFAGCFSTKIDHEWGYEKFDALRNYTKPQLYFFAQDLKVEKIINEGGLFFKFYWDLFPIYITVYCKRLLILDDKNIVKYTFDVN